MAVTAKGVLEIRLDHEDYEKVKSGTPVTCKYQELTIIVSYRPKPSVQPAPAAPQTPPSLQGPTPIPPSQYPVGATHYRITPNSGRRLFYRKKAGLWEFWYTEGETRFPQWERSTWAETGDLAALIPLGEIDYPSDM